MEPSKYKMSKSDINLDSHGASPSVVKVKSCVACTGTNTTLWRNGPDGPKTLCNACGIRFRKEAMKINTDLRLGPPDYVLQFSARGRDLYWRRP
ncbi:hypothetical protein ZIOFF_034867 [Zingiber officinale]|uniref:GATA-type domain-containing protein n=1 Tax=Zingiber officinale TaxID=94328 RepID=A0A8J5GF31_ZINOF|nr:hypothetical protein ZIOFF_034867 [Zingiber officinale]